MDQARQTLQLQGFPGKHRDKASCREKFKLGQFQLSPHRAWHASSATPSGVWSSRRCRPRRKCHRLVPLRAPGAVDCRSLVGRLCQVLNGA